MEAGGRTELKKEMSKNIKDNVICLNKQQMKDAVAYLLFNYFTVGPKIFCQIIGTPMGSDPAPFFANLFLYLYKSKWMNELKKNDLIKVRKLCNIFRFVDDLNSIIDRVLIRCLSLIDDLNSIIQ